VKAPGKSRGLEWVSVYNCFAPSPTCLSGQKRFYGRASGLRDGTPDHSSSGDDVLAGFPVSQRRLTVPPCSNASNHRIREGLTTTKARAPVLRSQNIQSEVGVVGFPTTEDNRRGALRTSSISPASRSIEVVIHSTGARSGPGPRASLPTKELWPSFKSESGWQTGGCSRRSRPAFYSPGPKFGQDLTNWTSGPFPGKNLPSHETERAEQSIHEPPPFEKTHPAHRNRTVLCGCTWLWAAYMERRDEAREHGPGRVIGGRGSGRYTWTKSCTLRPCSR